MKRMHLSARWKINDTGHSLKECNGASVALKPTIYKFKIALTDLNRQYYDTLNLTIAQHPSETLERMMARMLAFCLNAQEWLTFTKGLSSAEEPDLWAHTPDGRIALWIDVGEPAPERIKKATRIAQTVKVYSFNSKSNVWWMQEQEKFNELTAAIYQFQPLDIQALAKLAQRTMDISVTISEQSAYVAAEAGECEVGWATLQAVG